MMYWCWDSVSFFPGFWCVLSICKFKSAFLSGKFSSITCLNNVPLPLPIIYYCIIMYYLCVTTSHTFSNFKHSIFIIWQFQWSRHLSKFNCTLWAGPPKGTVKVSAGFTVSSKAATYNIEVFFFNFVLFLNFT